MRSKTSILKTMHALLLFMTFYLTSWHALSQDDQFSAANNLLFNLDHLANITEKSRLSYHYVKSGSVEPGFEDDIHMDFKPADSIDKRGVNIEFFSGNRNRWTPDFNGAQGNPLLTIFLQRDINEMSRLTGGQWRHFQKRIKLAFENNAKIEPVTFEYSGKEYQGKKITIYPYLDDPYNKRFKQYAGKYYIFTVAEKLPGMIYQIISVSPNSEIQGKESVNKIPPLLSESITLASISRNLK